MRLGLRQPWVRSLEAVYASTERKALDGAEVLAAHCGLAMRLHAGLGENDRSATGYLPPEEFERVADAFFASPEASVRGWERALDAQRRVVAAVEAIDAGLGTERAVAIVAHGGVGTLLYCHLAGEAISRQRDQPPTRGGNYFAFTLRPRRVASHWLRFDEVAAAPGSASR